MKIPDIKNILLGLLLLLSGCGQSAAPDGTHSLTLKQRYDNSLKELSTSLTQRKGASDDLAYAGFKAALDFLKSNDLNTLKSRHFVYYRLTNRDSKEPRITVFWVGDELQLTGIKIIDPKNHQTFNTNLPGYFSDDIKQKEKSSVFYAAIFDVDNETYQSLKKDNDEGDKFEIEAK